MSRSKQTAAVLAFAVVGIAGIAFHGAKAEYAKQPKVEKRVNIGASRLHADQAQGAVGSCQGGEHRSGSAPLDGHDDELHRVPSLCQERTRCGPP